jgi:diaminohydroxyphosphoribosylaminopyrimidine deaminase / 5-amino-6-(5-phosphoribosylamino)uracil reductase
MLNLHRYIWLINEFFLKMYTKDEEYHQRCLTLAAKGLGYVAPNPLVGAILVVENRIIGEGYHKYFGGPHAEVYAIQSVKDQSVLKNATLYVNLEPCSHYGKTPPCTDLIIEKKIPRVVIGMVDPFKEVAGKGIEKLKAAKTEVVAGINEKDCIYLNRRFLTFHLRQRPYIILKWAVTSDGFIDVNRSPEHPDGPTIITDELSRTLSHKWRTEEQAIMVGTNTAANDNPMLNARFWSGKNPIRFVVDRHLRLPGNLNLFDNTIHTIVFTEKIARSNNNIEYATIDFSKFNEELFSFCVKQNIQSILVEGGAKLLSGFIQTGQWDEARVFKSNFKFNSGVKGPEIGNVPIKETILKDTQILYYHNNADRSFY